MIFLLIRLQVSTPLVSDFELVKQGSRLLRPEILDLSEDHQDMLSYALSVSPHETLVAYSGERVHAFNDLCFIYGYSIASSRSLFSNNELNNPDKRSIELRTNTDHSDYDPIDLLSDVDIFYEKFNREEKKQFEDHIAYLCLVVEHFISPLVREVLLITREETITDYNRLNVQKFDKICDDYEASINVGSKSPSSKDQLRNTDTRNTDPDSITGSSIDSPIAKICDADSKFDEYGNEEREHLRNHIVSLCHAVEEYLVLSDKHREVIKISLANFVANYIEAGNPNFDRICADHDVPILISSRSTSANDKSSPNNNKDPAVRSVQEPSSIGPILRIIELAANKNKLSSAEQNQLTDKVLAVCLAIANSKNPNHQKSPNMATAGKETTKKATTTTEKPKSKNKKTIIIIFSLLGVIAVVVGGAGTFYYYKKRR